MPRAFEDIFKIINEKDEGTKFHVRASYFEVYKE